MRTEAQAPVLGVLGELPRIGFRPFIARMWARLRPRSREDEMCDHLDGTKWTDSSERDAMYGNGNAHRF